MGNKAGKLALNKKDITRITTATGFDGDHIKALYSQFLNLKGVDEAASMAELTINFAEFQAALGHKSKESSSIFTERIFGLFDENRDGLITFEEFLQGIAVLTPTAPAEAKLRFTFQIYDADKKNYISQSDLKTMLVASLKENDLHLSSEQIDRMVADTFKQFDLNKDGFIDFNEYKNMCTLQPNILKPLTINVADLIKQATAEEAAATGGAGKA